MTPKISLAIIAKESDSSLNRCISSVIKYVDEIVVVINKGADITNVNPAVITYFERKWNHNFADARNYSFKKCKNDIILWLDADDTVHHPELLPELAKKIANNEFDWVDIEYLYEFDDQGRVVMRHRKPRLMRKGSGNWVGRVHESFISTEPIRTYKEETAKILHHQAPGHHEDSGIRNLEILLKEYSENKEKTDPRSLYYLANTLMGLGKIEEAIPFYQMHIAQCGWLEEKFFSMHYLGHCLSWSGKQDEAINIALESLKLFPDWSLAYYDVAEYYSFKKDWWKVIEWTLTGLGKDRPDPTAYFTNDLDYDVNPYGRLVDAYLEVHAFDKAYELAEKLILKWPNDPDLKQMRKDCQDVQKGETFVKNFIQVAGEIRNKDRLKAVKLFDCLPTGMDADARIQEARKTIVPPKNWEDKSIVFYCAPGHDEWAYPSLFSGIGGSEEMVIRLSAELVKLGYKVTVYCKCGSLAGIYKGVLYEPYYKFNHLDIFDTLVVWRYPGFMAENITAKRKYVWLHDIVHESTFNEDIINNTDKFLFLSKWHRSNVPNLPEEKVYLTRNAIESSEVVENPVKRPNSLVYTSSYDRGAVCLGRDILPLIEKEIPDVTLDIAYGTGNLEKEMDMIPSLKVVYDEMQEIFKKPNVTHHGRLPHSKVAELQATSMVHAYPSEFGETFNISSVKAQANNTPVITTSQAGATPEYIRYGDIIKGDGIYSDKRLQQEFADAVIERLRNQHRASSTKIEAIIDEFSVQNLVKEWSKDLL